MLKFILKRIMLMFLLTTIVSPMTFLLTYIANENSAVTILHVQGTPNATPELIAETNEKYGFNDPLLIQYKNWLLEAIQFNFGTSYITGDPVAERTGPVLMNTLKLVMISSVMVVITSITLGVVSTLKRGKFTNHAICSVAFFPAALPSCRITSILIIYVSVKLNTLPTSRLTDPESYILSVIVIAIAYAGIYFRNVRRSMVEQLNEDYVLYLRASDVESITLMLHVLRNALQVAVSVFCTSISMIMGGLVVIEYIFAWPGLGQLSLEAVLEHDFLVIQAYVLIAAVSLIVLNTLVDIIDALLNPKLRGGAR